MARLQGQRKWGDDVPCLCRSILDVGIDRGHGSVTHVCHLNAWLFKITLPTVPQFCDACLAGTTTNFAGFLIKDALSGNDTSVTYVLREASVQPGLIVSVQPGICQVQGRLNGCI